MALTCNAAAHLIAQKQPAPLTSLRISVENASGDDASTIALHFFSSSLASEARMPGPFFFPLLSTWWRMRRVDGRVVRIDMASGSRCKSRWSDCGRSVRNPRPKETLRLGGSGTSSAERHSLLAWRAAPPLRRAPLLSAPRESTTPHSADSLALSFPQACASACASICSNICSS